MRYLYCQTPKFRCERILQDDLIANFQMPIANLISDHKYWWNRTWNQRYYYYYYYCWLCPSYESGLVTEYWRCPIVRRNQRQQRTQTTTRLLFNYNIYVTCTNNTVFYFNSYFLLHLADCMRRLMFIFWSILFQSAV